MTHSSPSWTEPCMLNTRVQLSLKCGNNPHLFQTPLWPFWLFLVLRDRKIIHRTEAIFSFNNCGTTTTPLLLFYKTDITREIKMILFFHLETMNFSSIKRTETITHLSLQIFQWKWGGTHYVAVLMRCFDEATEMPLTIYVKSSHTPFCINFFQKLFNICSSTQGM